MIDSLKKFFHALIHSCYDIEYYREVRTESAKRAFRYLAALVGLSVLIGALSFAPAAVIARDGLANAIKRILPDGTHVALTGGHLETNLPMPFDPGYRNPKLIVDTGITGTTAPELKAGTLLLGRDAAFFSDASGAIQSAPYEGAPNFSYTKEKALALILSVETGTIIGWAAALTLPWYIAMLIVMTISAASWALFAQWVGWFAKAPLKYGRWFAVACHAGTLPLVATGLFGDWLVHVPFGRTILFGMVMAAVIADERSRPTAHVDEAGTAKS